MTAYYAPSTERTVTAALSALGLTLLLLFVLGAIGLTDSAIVATVLVLFVAMKVFGPRMPGERGYDVVLHGYV